MLINTLQSPELLLFDWDGTLAVSSRFYTKALIQYLEERDLKLPEGAMGYIDDYIGLDENGCALLSDSDMLAAELPLIVKLFSEEGRSRLPKEWWIMANEVKALANRKDFDCSGTYLPKPGALEMLRFAQEKKLRMGIVSDAMRDTLAEGINDLVTIGRTKGLDLKQAFKVVIGREDCPERKPEPDPILLALKKLGVPPSKKVHYIGDGDNDVKSAVAAGVEAFFIPPYPSYIKDYNEPYKGATPVTSLAAYRTLLSRVNEIAP